MADIEMAKQGLKHHQSGCVIDRKECPYWSIDDCHKSLMKDALSVIEQMEQEIERLREIATRDCDICANKMLKDERRWIPVSERLPDFDDGEVLVARWFGEQKIVQLAKIAIQHEDGTKYWSETGITHWMFLPQPPKEGDGE